MGSGLQTPSVLQRMRSAAWRTHATTLVAIALLAQLLVVAVHLGARAATPFWDDPSTICSGGADAPDRDDGAPRKAPSPACPLCQAAHQLATALPPASPAIIVPPRFASAAPVVAVAAPIATASDRQHLPRGPPAPV